MLYIVSATSEFVVCETNLPTTEAAVEWNLSREEKERERERERIRGKSGVYY